MSRILSILPPRLPHRLSNGLSNALCLILCVTLSSIFFSTPVWAGGDANDFTVPSYFLAQMQEGAGVEGEESSEPRAPEAEEPTNRIRDLRNQQSRIDVEGPRKARLAGGILLGVGAGIAALAAATCAVANAGIGTDCREDNATGLEIGGGAVAVIGLITLVAGNSTLKAREGEVDEYERKIRDLNEQRNKALPVDARLSLGEDKMLTLSWRF